MDALGYFCHKFEETNKTDFIFGVCKNPFSSKETKQVSQLMSLMKTKEKIIKYIDWAFEKKQR